MKPEVHNVSQRRQRRTVPRTQVTCKKCGEDRTRSSRDIWSRTDSQTDTVITILCFPYSVIVCSKSSSCSWSIILGCNICSGFPVPITIITSVMCNNYLCKFLKVQRLHFTGAVDCAKILRHSIHPKLSKLVYIWLSYHKIKMSSLFTKQSVDLTTTTTTTHR